MAGDDGRTGGDNVVFLAFKNPNMTQDSGSVTFRGCSNCKNKTFTVIHDRPEGFPMLRCACCGSDMGRIGWADDDEG